MIIHRNPRILGSLFASAGALLLLLLPVLGVNAPAEGGTSDTPTDEQITQDMIDLLTVSTASDSATCATDLNGLVAYDIGALKGVPPRQWSDALSTPMAAIEANAALDELQAAICEDPLLGVSYATFFATDVSDNLASKTGTSLTSINSWLEPYNVGTENIDDLAAGFIPLLDVDNPSDEQAAQAVSKNRDWQELASLVNTLLERFAVTGIEARPSVVNYHLANGGLVAGALPTVERNANQENLPALILSATEKGQCVPLLVIGANMGDKRPELFEPPPCAPPTAPPPTTPPPTNPPPTSPPPTTPPPPDDDKDPSQDPAPRGNAPEGGGRNEDPGPGVYVPPEDMEQPPATPRTNPPAPAPDPTVPPTGSTPDPAPAPPPQTGGDQATPVDESEGTSCAPGIASC